MFMLWAALQSIEGGTSGPVWILATGIWNDAGVWSDSSDWID
jgi:hypothetical protein